MTPSGLAGWGEFAVMIGRACAVLAGLIFLELSINTERVLRVPACRAGRVRASFCTSTLFAYADSFLSLTNRPMRWVSSCSAQAR